MLVRVAFRPKLQNWVLADVERFGLNEGWDFSLSTHRRVRAVRYAHIEHPEKSCAWKTKACSTLPGFAALFDQCGYGATAINNDAFRAIKKST